MVRTPDISSVHRLPAYWFALLAVALLVLTLLWQVPMMLWDGLDLVPMLEAWHHGQLAHSAFFSFQGAHVHTAAYAVLLVTAQLSGGHPWLADTVSWCLLVVCGALVFRFTRESFPANVRGRTPLILLLIFLALYPGHLANLQWSWQVAVFLCLLGVVVAIYALTRPQLTGWHTLVALAGAALALSSFATGVALLPVALLLIALRQDQTWKRRALAATPWAVASVLIATIYAHFASPEMARNVPTELLYLLNFTGAGIARLATDLAPALGAVGIVVAVWAAWRTHRERVCLPWIGLTTFSVLTGVLVSLGRADIFGPDQAFVTRYVSFSSVFWLGLVGLLGRLYGVQPSRSLRTALIVVCVFAFANASNMIHKAQEVGIRTHRTAQTIRSTWPHVDDQLLAKIYFDQPHAAQHLLEKLHAWRYAPFDGAAHLPAADH